MPRIKHRRSLPTGFGSLVRLMPPCAIRGQIDYENTQEMIDALTSVPVLSPGQEKYLDTLTVLFEAYEAKSHEIDVSGVSPRELLAHLLRENDMSPSDLGRLLGEKSWDRRS